MKYYAVKAGREPGIYETWTECKEQTLGYSGAIFKAFTSRKDAEQYITQTTEKTPVKDNLPFAYIDGSFSKKRALYSWGGYINDHGRIYILQGTGNAADYMQYRNITGEVRGALNVMQKAIELGISEINLYYDYAGIEQWADNRWKCKTQLSQFYKSYYEKRRDRLKINFIHVKGHTGIEGNEIADYLAKEAAGAKLRKKDIEVLKAFRAKATTAAAYNEP